MATHKPVAAAISLRSLQEQTRRLKEQGDRPPDAVGTDTLPRIALETRADYDFLMGALHAMVDQHLASSRDTVMANFHRLRADPPPDAPWAPTANNNDDEVDLVATDSEKNQEDDDERVWARIVDRVRSVWLPGVVDIVNDNVEIAGVPFKESEKLEPTDMSLHELVEHRQRHRDRELQRLARERLAQPTNLHRLAVTEVEQRSAAAMKRADLAPAMPSLPTPPTRHVPSVPRKPLRDYSEAMTRLVEILGSVPLDLE